MVGGWCRVLEYVSESAVTMRFSTHFWSKPFAFWVKLVKTSPLTCLLVGLSIFFSVSICPGTGNASGSEQNLELAQPAARAAGYLAESVTSSGRFVYRRDRFSGVDERQRYNFLRHAGAVLAMAEFQSCQQDQNGLSALRRAARYLVDCCIEPVPDQTGMLALWSIPELTASSRPVRQAKLGGAGLALAALIQVESVLPGTTEPGVLRQLAEFILFMQKPDGSFTAKFIPSQGGRDDSWVSLYYPGEAALGLIMLYEHDGDPRWLIAAMDGLRYLARIREGKDQIPADHWALMASARLFRQIPASLRLASPARVSWNKPQGGSIKRALTAHVATVVEKILAEQIKGDEWGCLSGGFNPEGRVAPTATRLEGLLAAWHVLPQGALRQRVRRAVDDGIDFLLAAQVDAGPYRGAFTRYHPGCISPEPRADEIRIDYVQHALAAMMAYEALFVPTSTAAPR